MVRESSFGGGRVIFSTTQEGALGSTRGELERVLPALPDPLPLLEVETYTWGVLDASWRPERDLVRGIARELEFAAELVSGPERDSVQSTRE